MAAIVCFLCDERETMRFRKIDESPETFILVFEIGDELAEGLLRFAKEQGLSEASFKAVGAFSSVRLGWFSWESKQYEPSVTLDEKVELLSLMGDVAQKDGLSQRVGCTSRNSSIQSLAWC